MLDMIHRWLFVPRNKRRTTKWTYPHRGGAYTYLVWERKPRDIRWGVIRDGCLKPTYAEGQATTFGHARMDAEDVCAEYHAILAQ